MTGAAGTLRPTGARSSACRRCCCRSPRTARSTGPAFESLLARTVEAGLVPAVNMDTGYVQLLDADDPRARARPRPRACGAGRLRGRRVRRRRTRCAVRPRRVPRRDATRSARRGGTPVVFPSHGLNALDDDEWVAAHEHFGAAVRPLHRLRARPDVRAVRPDLLARRVRRPARHRRSCIGAKHSSLSRAAEWDRLAVRDRVRPDFHVFTGNDLAIDMVCYGSDYLLGLSAFAPEAFAERDRRWAAGDASFHELNDLLQYLGALRVPRAGPRLPPRRRAVPAAPRPDRRPTPHRRARRDGPTATAPSSPTSPSGWRRCCDRRRRSSR